MRVTNDYPPVNTHTYTLRLVSEGKVIEFDTGSDKLIVRISSNQNITASGLEVNFEDLFSLVEELIQNERRKIKDGNERHQASTRVAGNITNTCKPINGPTCKTSCVIRTKQRTAQSNTETDQRDRRSGANVSKGYSGDGQQDQGGSKKSTPSDGGRCSKPKEWYTEYQRQQQERRKSSLNPFEDPFDD